MKKVETLAESFVLLDSLIFKLVMTPDKEAAVLAIPEICIDKSIALYHTSLFAGHQGVVKTYLTMKDKFSIDCSSIYSPIFTSRTWYQDTIPHFDETLCRTRPDVA